jgi:hypothetical protein
MGDWTIQAMRGIKWPIAMRIALATQVRWRVRRAVVAADVRSALALVRFARKAFGMVAIGSVLTSRYNAGGGAWEA